MGVVNGQRCLGKKRSRDGPVSRVQPTPTYGASRKTQCTFHSASRPGLAAQRRHKVAYRGRWTYGAQRRRLKYLINPMTVERPVCSSNSVHANHCRRVLCHLTCDRWHSTVDEMLCLCTYRLVRLHPDLLLYDVRKTLAPRVSALQRLFPDSPGLRVLMRAPDLLYHDPETYLLPKMGELRQLLPGVDVDRLVR